MPHTRKYKILKPLRENSKNIVLTERFVRENSMDPRVLKKILNKSSINSLAMVSEQIRVRDIPIDDQSPYGTMDYSFHDSSIH